MTEKPDAYICYGEAGTLEVRVESQYGLSAYLGILTRECDVLNALAAAAQLPTRAYEQASMPRVDASVSTTGGEIPDECAIDWELRYRSANVKPPAHRPSAFARLCNELARRLAHSRVRRFVPKAIAQHLTYWSQVFLANDAPCPQNIFAARRQSVEIGAPPAGLRVPMFSGSPSATRASSTAIVVSRALQKSQAPAIADALFKCGTESLFDENGQCSVPDACPTERCERGPAPRISVITVSYNQAAYLEECLDSVLSQGYPNLEYIVIDGGSTDGSREILERYRSRLTELVIEKDRGQSHALNKGFAKASGEVMTWLCSDDRLEPGSLAMVADAYLKTGCDLVVGGCRVIDGEGSTTRIHHSGFITETVSPLSFGDLASFSASWQRSLYFYQPEVFFTRALWNRAGSHVKEHLFYAMDYDLFLRFALAGASLFATKQVIGCTRQHVEQKTRHDVPTYLPTVERLLRDYRNDLGEVLASSRAGAGRFL